MSIADKFYHPGDLMPKVLDELQAGRPEKDLSISSLPGLDNKLWGLKKKNLVVVGGRPSQGKSSLMLQMATDFAKQGKTVYFFSLEMTAKTCCKRILSNKCGIDNHLVNSYRLSDIMDMKYKDIVRLHKELEEQKLVLAESYGVTMTQVLEAIEKIGSPDVIFIDYINLIKNISKDRKESIDEYIKTLRCMAIERDFCAIIGAQINRSVHGTNTIPQPPNIWNLKETGSLEEHADMVLLVHWDLFYRKQIETDGQEVDDLGYIIKVGKNREGRTGNYECRFEPEFYKITE